MPSTHDTPIPSKVALMQHPLHPMVVVFPIAFLMAAPVTDALFWWLADDFWARVSFWLLVAGLGMGVLAALLGTADFLLMREVRRHVAGWSHFIVAIMGLSLAATNVQLRWADPVAAALPWGLLVSALTAMVIGVAGWLGGTLTFRHGIGTYVHERDAQRLEEGGDAPEDPVKE
jgi:uncharacterized membrane protein